LVCAFRSAWFTQGSVCRYTGSASASGGATVAVAAA
jgi:hypothetical protein